jgi:hypothetical protein
VPFLRLADILFRDAVILTELLDEPIRVGFRPFVDFAEQGIEIPVSGAGLQGEGNALEVESQENQECRDGQDFSRGGRRPLPSSSGSGGVIGYSAIR